MIRKLNSFLSAALILACMTGTALADRPWVGWIPEDGVKIRQGKHIEWYRGGEGRYLGNLQGEVAFIWSDCRYGDRGVYMQVIDQNGNTKFDDNGVKISDALNRQEDPQVWPSTDGGWYIAWEDFNADSLGNIYASKIDGNGNRIQGWGGEEGIPICTADGVQFEVRITDDLEGGCIIAWIDQRGGDTADLYAQHILANGRIDPNWRANGITVASAQGAQNGPTADADGQGGMILGWKDGREAGNFNVWAQRITPAGQLLWGNGQGIIVCGEENGQDAPKVCPDGAGGAFFVWVDDRNLPIQGRSKDLYVQRINSDGQLLWNEDGEALCTENGEQTSARIVNSASGEATIVWEDKRADGLTYDVYAMRISGANQLRKEWDPPSGVPIAIADRNQQQARLYPDGQGGSYFVWEDERDGGFPQVDIWAQHLNRNGQPVWTLYGIPICRAPDTQNAPLVRRTADGGMVAAWADYRTGSGEIWGQTVSAQGQIGHDEDGVPIAQGIGGNATQPRGFARPDGSITIYWTDGRFGGNGQVPFMQTINYGQESPQVRFQFNGISVTRGTQGGGIFPDGCDGGDGNTIIAWADHRIGDIYSIYAQRISSNGELLWGDGGLKVAEYFDEQASPRVSPDNNGGAYVGWRAPSADIGDNNIYVQHLNADGDRLWGDAGIAFAVTDADEQIEQMIPDGEGGVVITWQKSVLDEETFEWDDNIWAGRLNANGDRLWGDGDEGIPVVATYGRQRSSRIAKNFNNGYVIVWVDGRDDDGSEDPGNNIFGQYISPDGQIIWPENGRILVDYYQHQDNPDIAISNHGKVWMVWEDHRNIHSSNHIDIYMNKFTPPLNGNERIRMLFGPDGKAVDSVAYNQLQPTIIHDGQNGAYVAWTDYRNLGIHSDIYANHFDPYGRPYNGWDRDGNMITTAFHKQEAVQLINFTPGGEVGAVALWEDKRSTGKEELSNIYVQLLESAPLETGNNEARLPFDFEIESIAPNPFNPTAIMTYSLATAGNIRIGLYDIGGRLVQDYGTEMLTAGRHRIILQGQDLSTGSYIVRLENTAGSVEHKVQLIK